MKAVILTALNAPLTVADIEPEWTMFDGNGEGALRFGQVRVRMSASGICGAQLLEIGGHKGNGSFLPHLLGHEGAGRVTAIGPGVDRDLLNRKVVCHWRPAFHRREGLLPRYTFQNQSIGAGPVTTLCEHPIISENRVTPVDDDVPDELCALLGCGLSTALGTMEMEANLRMGESVLIVGAGGLGLNLVQAARVKGAAVIVAMDIVDDKAEPCSKLGATKYINCKKESIRDAMHLLGLKSFDVIVDTTGSVEALEATIPLTNGRYIMVGQPKPGEDVKLLGAANMFFGEGKMIKATQGGKFDPMRDIPKYVAMWRAGLLDIDTMITHRIPLQDINAGIDMVRAGQAGRILVEM